MPTTTDQGHADLTNRIAAAAAAFASNGTIESPEQFLNDLGRVTAMRELLDSGNAGERDYALVVLAFREETDNLAAQIDMPQEPDASYVDTPIGEEPVACDPANPALEVANTPSAIPEPEEENPLLALLDARTQKILGWLTHYPVLDLGLKAPSSVAIRVPKISGEMQASDSQRVLAQYVVAPLMRAAGIVSIEIQPSVFDIVKGREVELDVSDEEKGAMWLRSVIHHVNMDMKGPPRG